MRQRHPVSVERTSSKSRGARRRMLAASLAGLCFGVVAGSVPAAGQGFDTMPLRSPPATVRLSDCDAMGNACDAMGNGFAMPMDSAYEPFSGEVSPLELPSPGRADDQETLPPSGDEPDSPSDQLPAEADADGDDALDSLDELGDTSGLDAPNLNLGGNLASLGAAAGAFSAAPTMTGDLFGSGVSQLTGVDTRTFSNRVQGFILNGAAGGSPNAQLGFAFGGGPPDDVFSNGAGADMAGGDGFADQFAITEPIPPSDAPTAPGPGFLFDGGTATYADGAPNPQEGQFADGEFWFVNYSYSQTFAGAGGNPPVIIAGPDAATRRVKISENFSPEVRNRCYINYSFFNDAFGGLGDVSRWVVGLERTIYEDMISLELRQPMAATYGSRQQIDSPGDRDFELGNLTLISKIVLWRQANLLWSAGLGTTVPLADDAKLMRGNDPLLIIRNQAVHLLPYTGVLLRKNRDTAFQGFLQLDVDTRGNDVSGNLAGGPLSELGTFTDSTLFTMDVSAHHTLYDQRRSRGLTQIIGNAELHYTGTLQDSDIVTGPGIAITNLANNFNVVNATFSSHLVFGNQFVVTPGMSVPLRDGLDEQFDYEAMVQLNYLH